MAGREKVTKVPKRFGTTFWLPQQRQQASHETSVPVRRSTSADFRHYFNLPSPDGELFFSRNVLPEQLGRRLFRCSALQGRRTRFTVKCFALPLAQVSVYWGGRFNPLAYGLVRQRCRPLPL